MKRFRLGHYLKTSMWFVPLLFVLGGIVLSLVTTGLDDGTVVPQRISGDPQAALQILYLISFSMLSLTGLVLSLVVVVVQLAMGVFSPRIVRQILQDRPSQAAIGLFAGTFAHSILTIRVVRSSAGDDYVPGVAVVVALALVLVCIGALLWYVDHIGQSLRVAALVGWVSDDTITALDEVFPDRGEQPEVDPHLVSTARCGVVFRVEHERLTRVAERADCRLELLWAIGDFVPSGAPLVRIVGDPGNLPHRAVTKCVAVGPERTLNQDVAYGIRMLVDIAERSLSSGPFEDPTTAVQSLDRIHEILRQMARRPLHSGEYADAQGTVRLVAPTLTWDGHVRLAFDEIRQAGAGSPQVARRLRAALEDLIETAPAQRRPPLDRQLALLEDETTHAFAGRADREAALVADPSGLGSSADLLGR